jgi:hypothetical protein
LIRPEVDQEAVQIDVAVVVVEAVAVPAVKSVGPGTVGMALARAGKVCVGPAVR